MNNIGEIIILLRQVINIWDSSAGNIHERKLVEAIKEFLRIEEAVIKVTELLEREDFGEEEAKQILKMQKEFDGEGGDE